MSDDKPGAGPDDSEDYFLTIESKFACLRGTPFVFSATDWMLMKGWFEEGVPLSVVLEGLETSFEKRQAKGRRGEISSLSYCKGAVRSIWKERQALGVGGEDQVPETDIGSKLAELSSLLESARQESDSGVGKVLTDAIDQIDALKADSAPRIEEALIAIESELLEKILEALPSEVKEQIDADVEQSLEGIDFADEEAAERTRRSGLIRELRRRASIPRLTLF